MIYASDDHVLIRSMAESDPKILCAEERAQGWRNATAEKYRQRLADHASGKAVALVAEYNGQVAGYVSVYMNAVWDACAGKGYCGIVDLGVLEKYRRQGIGSRLMDAAEAVAAEYGDTVWIGVGLHSGYGSAQRMYVKRGYIPDGKGVWYGAELCKPYETYCNDDDLTLRLSKKLR